MAQVCRSNNKGRCLEFQTGLERIDLSHDVGPLNRTSLSLPFVLLNQFPYCVLLLQQMLYCLRWWELGKAMMLIICISYFYLLTVVPELLSDVLRLAN